MTFNFADGHQGTPSTDVPPTQLPVSGGSNTLATVDIVVLVVYFLLVLAVGFWVRRAVLLFSLFFYNKKLFLVGRKSKKKRKQKQTKDSFDVSMNCEEIAVILHTL